MTRGETDKTWDKLGGVGTTWGESRMGDMVAKQQIVIGGEEKYTYNISGSLQRAVYGL